MRPATRASYRLVSLVAALALVSLACTGGTPSQSSGGAATPVAAGASPSGAGGGNEPYRIGLLPTISGASALNGQRMQWGAELAAEEINAAGGVNGHPIELKLEDTQLNPTTAVGLMNKLISIDHVQAFIGQASPVMLALSPVAAENKVVLINHSAVNPLIANAENYTFTNIADAASESQAIVPYVVDQLKLMTAATLTGADDIGRGAADAFKAAYEAKGGTIVAAELFDQQASQDLRPQLLKLRDAHPAAVYSTNAPNAIKQAEQIGFKTQWLSNVFFESPENLALAGDLANGTVYTFVRFDPDSGAPAKAFLDAYEAKYGGQAGVDPTPHIYAATAYDAVKMYAEAFAAVGYDGTAVRDYIRNLKDWEGATGTLNYKPNGAVIMPVALKTVENGAFKFIGE